MRAVIYARYSSDNQRDASIEDQVRLCRQYADKEGWEIAEVFADRAISGTSLLRPGYQAVMELARDGKIDIVLAEALDRLSRDQEETAALFKRLQFFGVELITVAEGQISELHVGLKGTMNALYLKDLALKTRRGIEGRVREGRSGGGLTYGYAITKEVNSEGERIRGGRVIVEEEAAVVRRIFDAFAAGKSPRAIAHALNADHIPGPSGRAWGQSTINGNWRRGTGILNNELYIGRMVWNRLRYTKDPSTGKRVSRLNPESEWIVTDAPALRIIGDELWAEVKGRQQASRSTVTTPNEGLRTERARRPAYLLSGLLKCGVCGGGYSKINATHYGCSKARNQGTCSNRLTIRRTEVEDRVLNGLKSRLMQPELVKLFVQEFNAEVNRLWQERHGERDRQEAELRMVQKDLDRAVDAVLSGICSEEIQNRITELEVRKADLTKQLNTPKEVMPALHPGIADVYAAKVANLAEALNAPDIRTQSAEALRALIEEVRLTPQNGALNVELIGELSALFALGLNRPDRNRPSRNRNTKRPQAQDLGAQITLVAGVGFEPTTFRL